MASSTVWGSLASRPQPGWCRVLTQRFTDVQTSNQALFADADVLGSVWEKFIQLAGDAVSAFHQ